MKRNRKLEFYCQWDSLDPWQGCKWRDFTFINLRVEFGYYNEFDFGILGLNWKYVSWPVVLPGDRKSIEELLKQAADETEEE